MERAFYTPLLIPLILDLYMIHDVHMLKCKLRLPVCTRLGPEHARSQFRVNVLFNVARTLLFPKVAISCLIIP